MHQQSIVCVDDGTYSVVMDTDVNQLYFEADQSLLANMNEDAGMFTEVRFCVCVLLAVSKFQAHFFFQVFMPTMWRLVALSLSDEGLRMCQHGVDAVECAAHS